MVYIHKLKKISMFLAKFRGFSKISMFSRNFDVLAIYRCLQTSMLKTSMYSLSMFLHP